MLHPKRAPIAAGHRGINSNLPENMRCLTSSEIHKWLTGQGIHHQPLANGFPVAGDFQMPTTPEARLQLADYLANLLSKDGNKLIELNPAPLARPGEWEAIDRFRSGLDETRPLISAPGHLFKSRNREEFKTMLSTLLGFQTGWSFYIYAAPSRTTLLIDERIEIWSAKKGPRNDLGRFLSQDLAA